MISDTQDSWLDWLVHQPQFLSWSFSLRWLLQVEEVKKFLEDPDAYAAANPVAAAPAASGGGEAKKEEKKARNTWVDCWKKDLMES